jgi:hypothetical protein
LDRESTRIAGLAAPSISSVSDFAAMLDHHPTAKSRWLAVGNTAVACEIRFMSLIQRQTTTKTRIFPFF